MSLSNEDFDEIMLPQYVRDNFDISGGWGLLGDISDRWYDYADSAIEAGATDSPDIYFLRILRLSNELYTAVDGYGVTQPTFEYIINKAFDYCGFATEPHEQYRRWDIFHNAFQKKLIEQQITNHSKDPLIRLTFKGRRSLLNAIGDLETPALFDDDAIDDSRKTDKEPSNDQKMTFDPNTMIVMTELIKEADKIRKCKTTGDNWVYAALKAAGVSACYEFPQKNKGKAYPKITALGAIAAKAKSE